MPPVAYDGLLVPVAAEPARPTPSPPVPAAPLPSPSAMTPEMSAALSALKRTPTSPPHTDPTTLPTTTTSSSRPGLPAWATSAGAGGEANPWALDPPPAKTKKPTDRGRVLRRAAVAVGIVAVVVGGWALSGVVAGGGGAGGEVSAGGALDDAVKCKQTLLRGRDLICVAPPSSLTELTPAERDARLARATALGIFAGMNRIIFEDNGRTWRTLVLTTPVTARGAPSTTVLTTEPTTVPPTSKAAPATGALDTTPP